MRWRTAGSTSVPCCSLLARTRKTTQYGAGAIGRVLEERGIELEYLIDEGDYRIVSGCRVRRGRGLAYACRSCREGATPIL